MSNALLFYVRVFRPPMDMKEILMNDILCSCRHDQHPRISVASISPVVDAISIPSPATMRGVWRAG